MTYQDWIISLLVIDTLLNFVVFRRIGARLRQLEQKDLIARRFE